MDDSLQKTRTFKDFDIEVIRSLAQEKGYAYTESRTSPTSGTSLYDNPRTETTQLHALDMTIDGLQCQYYTAEYFPVITRNNSMLSNLSKLPTDPAMAQSGLNTKFVTQVFAIELPYPVEYVYVESRTNITLNNILGLMSIGFRDVDRPELEGDFNEFFRIFTPKGQSLNAFTILAPNMMLRMLAHAGNYDIEFSNNRVYLYQIFSVMQPGKIPMSQQSYTDLLNFGVQSAQAMARAARPAQLVIGSPAKHMWELVNIDNTKLILTYAGFMGIFFVSALLFFTPLIILTWPFLVAIVVWFYVRYARLQSKKKRLVTRYGDQAVPDIFRI